MHFQPQPASRLQAVEEYYFSTKLKQIAALKAQGVPVLNLGIGSPDLPPHTDSIERLASSARSPQHHAYQSYQGIPALRTAFADFYARYFQVSLDPSTEIMPLIGSKEGIMHIAMAYLEAGDETLIPNPGYPTYAAACRLAGAKVRYYPLSTENHWLPDLEALEQSDLSKVKIMWLNYPHMPTGAQANPGFYQKLLSFARKHQILLVNDNPYAFVLNTEVLSMLSTPGMMEQGMELTSLSKSHNMAGWRVGALLGANGFLAPVMKFKSNMDSGMFLPLQEAAAQALQAGPEWFEGLNRIYAKRQAKVFEMMDLLGCRYESDQRGMFVWAKIPDTYPDAYALSDELLEKNALFITPGGIFGSQGDAYLRTSLCATEEIFDLAIQRIKTGSNGN